jgi:hypothetical protein
MTRPMLGPGALLGGGGGPRIRWSNGSAVSIAVLITAVIVLSYSAAAIATPVEGLRASATASGSFQRLAASSESVKTGLLASCYRVGPGREPYSPQEPWSDAYNPADGYIYLASSSGATSIAKPLCTFIKPAGSGFDWGTAFDPRVGEIVVTGGTDSRGFVQVLQGPSLVKTVWFGESACPSGEAWDPALGAMLIGDPCYGWIDLLYLSEVRGVTQAVVIRDAFNNGGPANAILVADGYIFAAGTGAPVDVFDERTLAFVGSFAVNDSSVRDGTGIAVSLVWDPLNDTVVLGNLFGIPREAVIFLDANSITTGKFTFSNLPLYFGGYGVDGVGYSPATREVYLSPSSGDNVFELSKIGELTRVYLGPDAGPAGLAYDPVNHDMYVCGFGSNVLYVIH